MKKILIVGFLALYSHLSNAQNASEVTPSGGNTTPVSTKSVSEEGRLNKLEKEMQALKRDNDTLKKQVSQLRSSTPKVKRKITVSRMGSKQVILE
jgi:septal ring factor EnvC (AmiA/AmiB activator)